MLELNRLYCMDCMEGMKQFPDKYFDAIVTDPPYSYPDASIDVDWIGEAQRISKRMFVAVGHWSLPKYLEQLGYKNYKDLIIFYSNDNIERNIIPVVVSGDFGLAMNHVSFERHIKGEETNHPCPLPLDMMLKLIWGYTESFEKICDPFMGSGTTAIACGFTGRQWIGFENNEIHYKEAVKRIGNYQYIRT